jgi:hypothetical protein
MEVEIGKLLDELAASVTGKTVKNRGRKEFLRENISVFSGWKALVSGTTRNNQVTQKPKNHGKTG